MTGDAVITGVPRRWEEEEGADPKQSEHLARLKDEVARFPRLPGVYLMKDVDGTVVYVGKARDLRSRVGQYLAGGDGRFQIEFLMRRVRTIDTVVCDSEDQAVILERDLIGRHKPRYNVRLKDDKAYLSIRIDRDAEWPRLQLVRRPADDGAEYFGPYSYSLELKQVLEVIKHVLPLRTCADPVLYNRARPCLEYQIKRCAGPCCLPVDRIAYRRWVDQAIEIIRGRTKTVIADLEERMELASGALRFEEAAFVRDRIDVLTNFSRGEKAVHAEGEHRDAFAIHREGTSVALSVLNFRRGRIADSANYVVSDVVVSDDEFLGRAVEEYYRGGREVPEEVLLPFEPENVSMTRTSLADLRGKSVEIAVPRRGSKYRLVTLAGLNARQHFSAKFDAETRYSGNASRLAVLAKLSQVPRRIECVDISNFQGSDVVGAVVVFFDGAPLRRDYKRYKISRQDKPDDFAAVHEVVTRRLSRGMETGEMPDLLLIDGGPGQLRSAIAARDGLGVTLDVVSIAKIRALSGEAGARGEKKPERLFTEWSPDPLPLGLDDPLTHLLQRIRDEVHRFVITYHKQSRAKRVFRSVLDDVPGVGPERRKRLIDAFGSTARMATVPAAELAKAGRMPLPLAEKILSILAGSGARAEGAAHGPPDPAKPRAAAPRKARKA